MIMMLSIMIIIITIIFHNYEVLTYVPGTNPDILHQLNLKNPEDRGILSPFYRRTN